MRKLILILFVLLSQSTLAQLIQNVEIEIVGRPTWQLLIPMQDKGLIFFIKTDQTKAKIISYNNELVKNWETDIFLDVERSPTSYTFDDKTATFLFRETSGMYYQLFKFNLEDGKFESKGFELREYFDDQDYVFLGDKIIMAGANEKGGAFFEYNFLTEKSKLTPIEKLAGNVKVQEFKLNTENNTIESLWAIKTLGYTNEKKKKGAYTKDAYLSIADFDLNTQLINLKKIGQKSGNFPMSGKTLKINGRRNIVGLYQSNTTDKGIFHAIDNGAASELNMNTHSFKKLLIGNPEYSPTDFKAIFSQYQFLINDPIQAETGINIGGIFYKSEFRTVSEQVYDPNYQNNGIGNRNTPFGRSNTRTQSKTVFNGYSYPTSFVANINEAGDLISNNRIDLKQSSPQLQQTLSYNKPGAVAYCVNGNLATKNYNIGSKPILYKLSNDETKGINASYIPSYQEVKYWYDNFFIADGSKNKIEVLQLEKNTEEKTSKKKRKKSQPTFTQIRKTIYLTKIASGS